MEVETSTTPTATPSGPAHSDVDTRSAVADAIDRLSAEGPAEHEAVEPAGDSGSEIDANPAEDTDRSSPGRDRDDKGRFAPVTLRAPQDWRPGARAEWERLPRAVQEEAIRLHIETRKTLDRAAALEKTGSEWQGAIAPFEQMLQATGMSAPQVVGALLQHFAALDAGSPQDRAQILAHQIRDLLGTDENAIRILADALEGHQSAGAPQAQPPAPQITHEQVQAHMDQLRTAYEQQHERHAAVADWRAFEATRPEFLSEPGFRQRIVAELTAIAQGRKPTHADIRAAYEAAQESHPNVRRIVAQRAEVERVKKEQGSRNAAAASGVKNEPAVGAASEGPSKNTREEVARQFKRAGRGTRI